MDVAGWLRKQLEQASPDLLRVIVKDFAEALMSAEVDALCGAAYGERSLERVNRRNGYRGRDWDTRVGSIELAVPKVREGSYFPGWLLQPRRRAEQAFVSVIADAYLAGVPRRAGSRSSWGRADARTVIVCGPARRDAGFAGASFTAPRTRRSVAAPSTISPDGASCSRRRAPATGAP